MTCAEIGTVVVDVDSGGSSGVVDDDDDDGRTSDRSRSLTIGNTCEFEFLRTFVVNLCLNDELHEDRESGDGIGFEMLVACCCRSGVVCMRLVSLVASSC